MLNDALLLLAFAPSDQPATEDAGTTAARTGS